MRRLVPALAAILAMAAAAAPAHAANAAAEPTARAAAVCADHPNQASAQRAKDTRDADGDGIYCESLPCPCLKPGQEGSGSGSGGDKPRRSAPRNRAQTIDARVTSVVDGDTIKVRAFGARKSFYTVRLIGIDTPESRRPGTPVECGAKRATSYMKRIALNREGKGRRVTLRTDPTQDTTDRYGRLLAYVTPRGKPMLQVRMLNAGWAKTYVYGGRRFAEHSRFQAAERRARKARRGVWRLCGGDFHKPA